MKGLLGDGCNDRLSDSERRWRYGADLYGAARRPTPFICYTCTCGVQWHYIAAFARGAGVTPSGHASGNYRDPLTTRTPPSPLIGYSKGVHSEVPARGTRRHSKLRFCVSRAGEAAKQLIVTSGTLTS